MVSMVKMADSVESPDPPGIYFVLEPKNNVEIDNPGIDDFEIKALNQDFPLISDILRNSVDNVLPALIMSLEGGKSTARFTSGSEENSRHYELHCFHQHGSILPNVGCFLIDRTRRELDKEQIEFRMQELALISRAVRAFGETRNLSEILRIILLAVTAGKGMGFNRCFILLSDDARECLWGCMATGPSSPEEAGRIWNDLSKDPMTFDQVLRLYKASETLDVHVNRLISSIKIPLENDGDFIARAVLEKQSMVVGPEMVENDKDHDIRDKFGVDHMAVVPLLSGESLQGVLLADNIITKNPILDSDLNILEIFARYASDAIENSRLYGKLETQLSLLKKANEQIIRSRENLVRAEKMSGIGRMALEVAHEVRNPLTIIGGYANLRLRKIAADDDSTKVLELISKQVNRIEITLDRFSSVVKLNEKKEDFYCLSELISETLSMLSSESNPALPACKIDDNILDLTVFLDKGLFHQALMAVMRQAEKLVNGMANITLDVQAIENTAMIFIDGGENNIKFAENFYSGLRKRKDEHYQDMAVALEILQHYGGDIGIGSARGMHGRLYLEIPLREGKS